MAKTSEERKLYYKEWFQKNKQNQNKYYCERRKKLRIETIKAYGGKCSHCGESDFIVLVLDHINNDACIEKQEKIYTGGYKMYALLKRNGWPKDRHQLLCHNCNFKKEYWRRKNAIGISQTT